MMLPVAVIPAEVNAAAMPIVGQASALLLLLLPSAVCAVRCMLKLHAACWSSVAPDRVIVRGVEGQGVVGGGGGGERGGAYFPLASRRGQEVIWGLNTS